MVEFVVLFAVAAAAGEAPGAEPACDDLTVAFPSVPPVLDTSGATLEAFCAAAIAKADASARGRLRLDGDGSSKARDVQALAGSCHRVEAALGFRQGAAPDEEDLANLRTILRPSPEQRVGFEALRAALGADATLRAEAGGAALAALSLGSLEGQLVRGLSQFLIDRARAEAELLLRKDLHQRLCTARPAATLLSRSCTALETSPGSFSLFSLGPYLRDAALADLRALPASALALAACRLPPAASPDAAATVRVARLGAAFAVQLRAGRDGFELLRGLAHLGPECPASDGPCLDFARTLGLAGTLLQALEAQGPPIGRRGAAMNALAAMVAFDEAYASDPARWRGAAPFRALELPHFAAMTKSLAATGARLHALRMKAEVLARERSRLSGERWQEIAALGADLHSVVADTLQAVPEAHATAGLIAVRASLGRIAPFVRGLVAAASAPATALAGLELVDHVTAQAKIAPPVPAAVSRALPLLASIASAESADEVAQTLAVAAAPAGAHRTKRERPQLSVTASMAASAGHEWLDDAGGQTDGAYAGLAVPVGLHATLPLGGSFAGGLYLSVLDLGTPVALRLETESGLTKSEPNVGLAQVFSPGAFLTVQWNALILGVGVSAAPALREIVTGGDGATGPQTRAAGVMRASLFVGLDLTLFSLR